MDLALIPLQRLNGALAFAGEQPRASKREAIQRVRELINAGVLNEANVTNATPLSAAPVDTGAIELTKAASAALDQSTRAQIQVQALHDTVQDSLRRAESDLTSAVDSLTRKLDLAVDRVNAKVAQTLSAVKASDSAEVQRVVNDLFDRFRTEVPETRLTEIAAQLPRCVKVRAGDLFPCTVYGSTDFSDLMVDVFNHQSPVLEDYVFNPEHLHQALVALADPLPDNVWLAGERGTGKTEFVTQIAARLKRPLFRVNFDEAMERADFIGANTIENGNVRFKDGVILQAIKTPGAIVLLDEIGFARAQTLATLHAVCERSQSRGLTIAETGERVSVASHVSFFCADNSNGFGDTSGNFAGVREQNSAFIDRFSYTLSFEYLPPVDEIQLIASRTGLNVNAVTSLVTFANIAREKARAGILTQPPSIRQLFAWARSIQRGVPVAAAFKNAVINKFPAECSIELEGIYTASINEAELQQFIGRV